MPSVRPLTRHRSRLARSCARCYIEPMTDIEPWSREKADLYELVHRSDDFHALAERLHGLIERYSPAATSLLDVACGTGWYLEELRRWYEVEGVDLSPAMLDLARRRLPDVPLHEADMREFDLGPTFDVVTCLSSSVASMLSRNELDRGVENMARHLKDGGVLVLEPWDAPEDVPGAEPVWTTTAQETGRAVALMQTTRLSGDVWIQESQYLIWTSAQGIRHVTELDQLGAFTKGDYETSLRRAGLDARYDANGLLGRGLHIGIKGAGPSDPS